MRTVAVVLAVAGLLGGCGGSDAPKESPAERTPSAEKMSRAEVERAVLEQTGAVALKCEREPEAPERWFCRQGDEEKGWYAVVQPDGSVTIE